MDELSPVKMVRAVKQCAKSGTGFLDQERRNSRPGQSGLPSGARCEQCRAGCAHHARAASRFAEHLVKAGGHTVEYLAQSELATNCFCILQVFRLRRPATPHQQVEAEGVRIDMVLLELRSHDHAPAPLFAPRIWRSNPHRMSEPDSGFRNPVSRAARVDLPPPEGPSSNKRSPG